MQIPYRGAASVAEHRALIELIAPGSGDEIEAAAREHKLPHRRELPRLEGEHQL